MSEIQSRPVELDSQWIRLGDSSNLNAPLIANVRRTGMVIGRVRDLGALQNGPRYQAELFRRGDWSSLGLFAEPQRAADAIGEAAPG